jgi:hypothetical protein
VVYGLSYSGEAVLDGLGAVAEGLLIAECDRAETHQAAAGIAHVLVTNTTDLTIDINGYYASPTP